MRRNPGDYCECRPRFVGRGSGISRDEQIELITFSVNWFISIFTASLPFETSLKVLDLFFLKGLHSNKVVFDVAIAILALLRKQIKECEDQALFYTQIFTSTNELLQNGSELLRMTCEVQ